MSEPAECMTAGEGWFTIAYLLTCFYAAGSGPGTGPAGQTDN